MKGLLVAVAVLPAVAAIAPKPSSAVGYTSEYYALRADLESMRAWHLEWARYLDRNPWYVPTEDVRDAATQWAKVRVYDVRLLAIRLLADGVTYWPGTDRSIHQSTLDDFLQSRDVHWQWASYLLSHPENPLRWTADGPQGQYTLADRYTWRIEMLRIIAGQPVP
jgi:hypothetical protein